MATLSASNNSTNASFKDREKPMAVRAANILAARAVADAVRTSLGPRGMDKMITNQKGQTIITNDGNTMLKSMAVMHPSAKMLVDLSSAQDVEAGDGTTSVVVIAGGLLGAADKLLSKGIHPSVIAESFQRAASAAVQILHDMSYPVLLTDTSTLLQAATTSLSSKIVSQHSSLLAPIAVNAITKTIDIKTADNADLKSIRIVKKVGGTIEDTEMVEGLALNQLVVKNGGGPIRMEKAKIGLIQFQLSPPKPDMENQIVVNDYRQMDKILKEERTYLLNMVKKIKKAKCNVLFIQKSILRDAVNDLSLHFLAKLNILCIKDIERDEVEFICRSTGCKPIADIESFTEDKLGSAIYNFTGEPPSLNPNIENTNSSNKSKEKSVVIQNKVYNTNMGLVTSARMFNLKDPAEENFNQGYSIDSDLTSSDRAKKMVYSQKTVTQSINSEDLEVESQSTHQAYPARPDDVALLNLDSDLTFDGTDSQEDELPAISSTGNTASGSKSHTNAAINLSGPDTWVEPYTGTPGFNSGQVTPIDEKNADDVSSSRQYNDGILSSLARLYSIPLDNSPQRSDASIGPSSQALGIIRPKMSTGSQNGRNIAQDSLPSVAESPITSEGLLKSKNANKGSKRGIIRRLSSATLTDMAKNKISSKLKLEEEVKITIHIAKTQSRQNYLLKLCRALMAFGAPTHRLEEYLRMSARVLEVQGSFLYIPGCMIISFDDATTHTNEVKLVKVVQAVNLGLLIDVHEIYKEVVHDVISVEEATQRLDKINDSKPIYSPWAITLIYGFASASVAPWAFQARYIDMPICFILGSIVGCLQHVVAPKCDLYNNVFEIFATVITSFLARAFGSIQDGNVFCFSALAQSSIALILPGYIVLCGCLEIQSKSLIAGSVRMVYGIIYSFFLGFGISVGTALYGLLDPNATNATTCHAVLSDHRKWVFVPFFTLCAGLVSQAKFRQLPLMIIIGFAGYIVNFLTFKRFPSSAQISNTLGALTVGLLGNICARMRHEVAAAAIVPALWVLVPSGIAASGSLLAGLSSADKITTGTSSINGTSTVAVTSTEDLNKIVFNVGNSMVQLAIGLTVGLFMSTLLVYPLGKRRSGLFAY